MSEPVKDPDTNDPEVRNAGQNSFEARARRASESVRAQLDAKEPGDELGLRRARRPVHRTALPRVAAAAVGAALLVAALAARGRAGVAAIAGRFALAAA